MQLTYTYKGPFLNFVSMFLLIFYQPKYPGLVDLFTKVCLLLTQLPGRLFSPSDISKKLSRHFLLHFPIDMSSYDYHEKYQGVSGASIKLFFIRLPALDKEDSNEFKGGTLMKKSFIEAP